MAQVKIRTYSKEKQLVNERRQQITKGALHLFLKNGYHQTSVRQIAEASGMSVGSIYHYIGSKEDILYLLIEEGLEKTLSSIRGLQEIADPVEALSKAVDKWNRSIDEFQDMTVFAYQEMRNLNHEMRTRLQEIDMRAAAIFERILSEGVRQDKFHVENVKLFAHTMLVLGHMWAFRRWFLRRHYTLEQYIQLQKQLILSAAGTAKAQEDSTPSKGR